MKIRTAWTTLLVQSVLMIAAVSAANPAGPASTADPANIDNLTDVRALSDKTGKLILVKTFSKY